MTYPQLLGWCINNNFQASWKDMVQSTLWTGLRIMVLAGSAHLVLRIFKAAQLKFLATFKVMAYGWISILLISCLHIRAQKTDQLRQRTQRQRRTIWPDSLL
jgi:hypothetical protein